MGKSVQKITQNVSLIASKDTWIEGLAIQQLTTTSQLADMRKVAGMPDLHPGRGYPIGAAFFTNNKIYPALVGNDIGCGMSLWQTSVKLTKVNIDKMAKKFADVYAVEDCTDTGYDTITSCSKFYEWNARVQLTTWNPTPKDAAAVPSGPIDYAAKHWSGLVRDYYAERIKRLTASVLAEAAAGRPWSDAKAASLEASLAYEWTTATNAYPTSPVGDAFAVSQAMHATYAPHFDSCPQN